MRIRPLLLVLLFVLLPLAARAQSVQPNPMFWGTVQVNMQSYSQGFLIVVKNAEAAGAIVTTVTAPYKIVAQVLGAAQPCSNAIQANGSCDVSLAFAPTNSNPGGVDIPGTLTIKLPADNTTLSVQLHGTCSGCTGSAPPSSQVATPTFNPAAGSYASSQLVTIADSTAGASIHFTLDGSTPTTASILYSSPISIGATSTVKALAAASGMTNSAIASATYTISSTPPPAGTTTVEICGTSVAGVVNSCLDATKTLTVLTTVPGLFNVSGNVTVPLTVTSASPTSGPPGTQFTMTGTGFVSTGMTYYFTCNGINYPTLTSSAPTGQPITAYISPTQITLTVPNGAPVGGCSITVTTP